MTRHTARSGCESDDRPVKGLRAAASARTLSARMPLPSPSGRPPARGGPVRARPAGAGGAESRARDPGQQKGLEPVPRSRGTWLAGTFRLRDRAGGQTIRLTASPRPHACTGGSVRQPGDSRCTGRSRSGDFRVVTARCAGFVNRGGSRTAPSGPECHTRPRPQVVPFIPPHPSAAPAQRCLPRACLPASGRLVCFRTRPPFVSDRTCALLPAQRPRGRATSPGARRPIHTPETSGTVSVPLAGMHGMRPRLSEVLCLRRVLVSERAGRRLPGWWQCCWRRAGRWRGGRRHSWKRTSTSRAT